EVREAAAAGLAGFAVNWAGTGSPTQTVTSNPYSKRLQLLVDAEVDVELVALAAPSCCSRIPSSSRTPAAAVTMAGLLRREGWRWRPVTANAPRVSSQ
ncbi:MAG TPA: hypothetical protein VH298_08810, partial [Jatrophihabitans sp.]|nr:hypothetical protein [Jatrophihabitans sp.]